MAIKVNVEGSTYAGPMKDTRAEGYITFYTKSGWDRWKMAAEQVDQAVKEQKMTYDAAVKAYKEQMDAIDKEKASLSSKLADIATNKAKAEWQNNLARWKAEDRTRIEKYKAEVGKATKEAQHPSWSYSYGWSKSYGSGLGSSVRASGGRDAADESLDDIGDGTAAHMSVSDATSKTNDVVSAAQQLAEQYALQKAGTLDNTQYGSGVMAAATYRQQASKLAQLSGYSLTEEQAAAELDKEIAKLPDGKVIAGNIKYGEQAILARAMGAGGKGGEGQHTGRSGGAYYGNITLPPMEPISATPIDVSSFDKATKEIEGRLATVGIKPEVPVLEPIDVITTARKTYAEKFGDVPRGTTINLGDSVIGHYKNLMPFEISEGMKKTEKFFAMYIDDAVTKAKSAALTEGRPFTVDDLNAATEAGKATAREVLFGTPRLQTKGKVTPTESPETLSGGTPTYESLGGLKTSPMSGGTPTYESLGGLKTSRPVINLGEESYPPQAPLTGPVVSPVPVVSTSAGPPILPKAPKYNPFLLNPPTLDLGEESYQVPTLTPPTPPSREPGSIDVASFLRGRTGLPPKVEVAPVPTPMSSGTAEKIMRDRLAAEKAGLLSPKAAPIFDTLRDTTVPSAEGLTPPPTKTPGIDVPAYLKSRTGLPPKVEAAPVPTPTVPKVDVLGQADKKSKTEAVLTATKKVMDDQKIAAKDVTKDAMGKYIATLYDENKGKGAKAASISDLTSTIIREYAGDATKQKKAVELLTQLAILDNTSNQIRS